MKLAGLILICASAHAQMFPFPGPGMVSASATVATPTDSPGAGSYGSTQTVTLSDSTSGATICYTTNGTTPAATTPGTCSTGTTYSTGISVSATTTVKAIGTKSGMTNSSVLSSTYTFVSPPTFVQSNQVSAVSGTATMTTPAQTNTAGHSIFAYWGNQNLCTSMTTGASMVSISNLGGDTWDVVYPPGGGSVIGVQLDSAGSGCSTIPAWGVSGGGAGSGLSVSSAALTGGGVTDLTLGLTGSGYTSVPILTASGGGCSVQPTGHVIAMGNSGGSFACTAAWVARNIAGHTNDTISVTLGNSHAYGGITTLEAANANTVDAKFDAVNTGSGSITSSAFTTTTANTICMAGARVEALSQTWTAGSASACADATGATCTLGATVTDTFMSAQYGIMTGIETSKTMSISSAGTLERELIGVCLKF